MKMTKEQLLKAMQLIGGMEKEFCAYDLSIEYYTKYKEHLDWHEFSWLCDSLEQWKMLGHNGYTRSGMCIYCRLTRGYYEH